MRLLLDEMHAPAIAAALRQAAIEVVAVAAGPKLRGLADVEILEFASSNRLTVVTENVGDFPALHSRWLADHRTHSGIIFTHPRRYPRASTAYPGTVIASLLAFAQGQPGSCEGQVHWLGA